MERRTKKSIFVIKMSFLSFCLLKHLLNIKRDPKILEIDNKFDYNVVCGWWLEIFELLMDRVSLSLALMWGFLGNFFHFLQNPLRWLQFENWWLNFFTKFLNLPPKMQFFPFYKENLRIRAIFNIFLCKEERSTFLPPLHSIIFSSRPPTRLFNVNDTAPSNKKKSILSELANAILATKHLLSPHSKKKQKMPRKLFLPYKHIK